MTGFAAARKTVIAAARNDAESGRALLLSVELRSVNSRFLDLSFRLSEELRAQEPALRRLLGSRLERGKVELRAALGTTEGSMLRSPPAALLQHLHDIQSEVRTALPGAASLTVAEVLQLTATAPEVDHAALGDALLALVNSVLAELLRAREHEGARLRAMLEERTAALRALAEQAGPLVSSAVAEQKQRFLARWNQALSDTAAGLPATAAQERALAEAAAYALRIDVAEELDRLLAHLDEIEAVLTGGGRIGKRLDFLIQELHREANTLGSKSATLELSRIAVDMKVLIEQLREQVQNIE